MKVEIINGERTLTITEEEMTDAIAKELKEMARAGVPMSRAMYAIVFVSTLQTKLFHSQEENDHGTDRS